jgi:MSHA biogenesis protein MshQ
MKLYSVWLIVLTMLMGTASAANVNFNGGSVSNCTLSGNTYSCTSSFSMGATDFVVIAGGYTVVMTSFSPGYNQGLTIAGTGALQTSGNLDLSNINPANVSTGGSTLTAGGSFSLGSAVAINGNVSAGSFTTSSPGSISGSITAAGTVFVGSHVTVGGSISGTTITTNSPVTISGSINASTSFTLASGSSVTGSVTSPVVTLNPSNSTVTGNITATTSLDIGSGNTVTGTVKGGSLTMRASNSVINGSVTMTGDVDMASGTTINGDLSARNVTTHSSNAVINGNAAVNSIYIDWNNNVTKTITCTGSGASGCSCVTKADPNYQPTCGVPPASVPHHFQISHTGTALTCQPQTVTVTACANAACAAPHFTSNVDVTTSPGSKVFTVSGGVNNAATVQSKNPGTFTLGAIAPGVSNSTVCVNSATGATNSGSACNMDFSTTGLKVSGTNHISLASGAVVTVEALTAASGNQSCVPLVPGQTVNVDMACTFSNPVNAANVPVTIGTKNLTCGAGVAGATVSVPFSFNNAGLATLPLSYAEVGQVGLSGSITNSNFQAVGNGSFIAAPAALLIKVSRAATSLNAAPPAIAATTIGPATLSSAPTAIFAKAGETFTLTVTAVNSNNVSANFVGLSNFGKEATPSKVKLTATINDSNSVPGGLIGTNTGGALSYSPFPVFASGSSTTTASFDDVGYLKIVPSLDINAYYLGQQIAIFQTTGAQYVSRFIPDHFNTVLVANTDIPLTATAGRTMSCDTLSASTKPCLNPDANSFIHSKQFYFLTVGAYNNSILVKNYNGTLAKAITLSAMSAKGGDTLVNPAADALSWSGEINGATPSRFFFPAIEDTDKKEFVGVGKIANPGPSSANLPSFKFASAYPDADVLPATIYLRAVDTDGVSSKRAPASDSVEAALAVVSGRMLVSNNYGSPKARLPVKVYAQYYMPSGYVFNPLVNDSGNGSVSSFFNYSNCQQALDISTGTPKTHVCPATTTNTFKLVDPSSGMTLKDGTATFIMEPPAMTMNGIGSVDVTLKKSNGNSIIIYLPSTTGRETFGVYRSGPVIYTRELY